MAGSPQERAGTWTTQRLYLKYTPDDPSTGANEEALLVKNGRNGATIAQVPGGENSYSLNNQVAVGETFSVVMTAASNGRPFQEKVLNYELYIDEDSNSMETDRFLVSIDGVCPP